MSQTTPKVAVVGTGSIGAMTLWRLAELGVPAVGFDRFAPGHDRGAAGGESRIFRMAYREGPEYVPLLQRARSLWEELDGFADRRLFHPSGFVTVGPEDHPGLVTALESARQHGLDHSIFDRRTAADRVPEHPLRPGETMLHDPNGGLLLPELAVLTAANRAAELGATLRSYTQVHEVMEKGSGVEVVTDDGRETFDQVIVSSGPWVRDLQPLEGLPLQPRQLIATWFPRRTEEQFVLGKTPPALRVGEPGFSCFPAVDGNNVKVIAHGAYDDIGGPEQLTRAGTAAQARRASAFVEEVLPGVHPQPVRVATYSDAYTPNKRPILGRRRGDSPVILAVGFSGHGFKMAPAFGEVLARMAVGDDHIDVGFLSPERF